MKYVISILLVFFFTGCNFINPQKSNIEFEKAVEKKLVKPKKINNDFGEKIIEKKYITFIVPKTLKVILDELGKIDGRVYYIENIEDNFEFPVLSSRIKIKSFFELEELVKSLTDFELRITENSYDFSKPKKIEIVNKAREFWKNKEFTIANNQSTISIKEALEDLMRTTGYNVIYTQNYYNIEDSTQNNNQSNNNQNLDFFEGKEISFQGKNYFDLLNTISNSFNLYLDISQKKNTITFTKYKAIKYKLIFKDQNIENSFSVGEGDETSEGKASPVKINIYKEIKEVLDQTIAGRQETNTSNKRGWIKVLKNGTVLGLVTKDTAKQIYNIVNDYNKDYSQVIEATITVYDYLVDKKSNLGTDFDFITSKIKASTNFLTGSFLTYENKNAKLSQVVIDSLNRIGNKISIKEYTYPLTNHIPRWKKASTNEDYFEKIETVQITNGDTPLFKSNPIVKVAKEGLEFSIDVSSQGGILNVNMSGWLKSILSINEKKQGEDVVSLKKDSIDVFVQTLPMEDGEIAIIDTLSVLDSAKEYEGIMPIEDFIIGGSNEGKYVRRINVITLGLKRIK